MMLTIDSELHTNLNRLITQRLPLALPLSTNDPAVYATGLLHFARIYIAFESAWDAQILTRNTKDLPLGDERTVAILQQLYLPILFRTSRLKNDLSLLLKLSPDEVSAHLEAPNLVSTYISERIAAKPHVLIAYAWVMYMALFNGGRWIRSQLVSARDSSWKSFPHDHNDSEVAPGGPGEAGLSFWHFDGLQDGEDIKSEFRLRIAGIEHLLEPQEWSDIVAEAPHIFRRCTIIVEELDSIMATRRMRTGLPATMPGLFTTMLRYIKGDETSRDSRVEDSAIRSA